jgi:uncharacterized membrane protein YjfL (UPF0719 family)
MSPLVILAGMSLFESLEKGLLETVIFAILGIVFCIIGYKVVDWLIPGDMGKQIADDKNVAIAIVAASMILGICIIVAAAIAF